MVRLDHSALSCYPYHDMIMPCGASARICVTQSDMTPQPSAACQLHARRYPYCEALTSSGQQLDFRSTRKVRGTSKYELRHRRSARSGQFDQGIHQHQLLRQVVVSLEVRFEIVHDQITPKFASQHTGAIATDSCAIPFKIINRNGIVQTLMVCDVLIHMELLARNP